MKMKNKIITFDLILVVVSVGIIGSLFWFYNTQGVQFSPGENVLFEFDGNVGQEILWSENINDFVSAERIILREGLVIKPEPGTYYLQINGEIRELTVEDGGISLRFVNSEGVWSVVNANEEPVNVAYYSYGDFEGNKLIGGSNA